MLTRSDLNALIGRTMRRIQLSTGHTKEWLRAALRSLNAARRALAEGWQLTAKSHLHCALVFVRYAKRGMIHA
jgi:hypothetical protein